MGRKVEIQLPYEDDLQLKLIDVAPGSGRPIISGMAWLAQTHSAEGELAEIFATTVALYQADAGTLEDCFEQSIVWARG